MIPPPMRAFWLPVFVLSLACQQPSDQFAWVEEPQATPVSLPDADHEDRTRSSSDSRSPAGGCTRGTGRTPSGECVPLRTRDLGHVQQVQIPAGIFMQGDVPDSYRTWADGPPVIRWPGQPPRKVAVESFWIDLHEVTRRAYETCVGAGTCTAATCAGQDPVAGIDSKLALSYPQTCVTHQQAQTFCQGHGGRLPTMAEWEFAARGIDGRKYPWGDALRDEVTGDLLSTSSRADASYFGILGMGSSAVEWVADEYNPEKALAEFHPGSFRDRAGPFESARREFETRLACGDTPKPGCRPTKTRTRHILKGGRIGAIQGGRAIDPPHPADTELEGWPLASRHPRWGFRCASDLGPGGEVLTVPQPVSADPVPPVRTVTGGQLFTGVAEAASRPEAERFCNGLHVEIGKEMLDDWKLPTVQQVQAMGPDFAGPGPFWLYDGAAAMTLASGGDAAESWRIVDQPDQAPLLARCFRATPSTAP